MSESRPRVPLCPPGFELPSDLVRLIENGVWPADSRHPLQAAETQIPASVVDPDSKGSFLFLHSPPFHTPRQWLERGEYFWQWPCASASEIHLDRALVIGDLGIGSDAPIILDYSRHGHPPCVRYLRWGAGDRTKVCDTHWVERSATFRGFALWIGLITNDRPS